MPGVRTPRRPRHSSVCASIATSVGALTESDARRYVELAAFPDDVAVPVSVIETVWRATGGLKPLDTRSLLARLNVVAFMICSSSSGVPRI